MQNYTLATVPPAGDIINHPLSMFIRSVIAGDNSVLSKITKDNYMSYIAAIAKKAFDLSSINTDDTIFSWDNASILSIVAASNRLIDTIEKQHIELDSCSQEMLNICFYLEEKSSQLRFYSTYVRFCKSIA